MTSNFGDCESDKILQLGKDLASAVLSLALEYCTKQEVNGLTTLYNPTTKAAYSLPCYDQDDYTWIPFIKKLDITANHHDQKPNFGIVIIEEAGDASRIQILRAEQLTRDGGTTVVVLDHLQRAYDWVYGSSEELQRFISQARYFIDMKNYRNALNIWEHVQSLADDFELGVQIEPMSDKYGVVAFNQTLNKLPEWLNDGKTVRIGCRLNDPLFKLFSFLLGKGFNVHLNGMESPSNMLESLVNHLKPNSDITSQPLFLSRRRL